MGTKDFTKKLIGESGIDEEQEELLGVENMIKMIDLEQKVSVLEDDLKEKDKEIEEKDKEIERLKAQLKER